MIITFDEMQAILERAYKEMRKKGGQESITTIETMLSVLNNDLPNHLRKMWNFLENGDMQSADLVMQVDLSRVRQSFLKCSDTLKEYVLNDLKYDVAVNTQQADNRIMALTIFLIVILVVIVVITVFSIKSIKKPVEDLNRCLIEIAKGSLKINLADNSRDVQEYKPITQKQLFMRKIKCAHCGYGMTYYRSNSPKYICKNGKVGYSDKCNHAIAYEKEIEYIVSAGLNEYIKLAVDRATMKKVIYEKKKNQAELCKKKIAQLKKSLNSLKKVQVINYENYLDEKISRKTYEDKQAELDTQINKINEQIEDINHISCIEDGSTIEAGNKPILERFIKNKENVTLYHDIINELVKEVIVYSKDRFEIVWRFKDFFQN